eukprot:2566082-Rhodomonas_salina.1
MATSAGFTVARSATFRDASEGLLQIVERQDRLRSAGEKATEGEKAKETAGAAAAVDNVRNRADEKENMGLLDACEAFLDTNVLQSNFFWEGASMMIPRLLCDDDV